MAAQARFLPEQMDANEASLMAEKSVVEFAVDYSFRHVRLEGSPAHMVGQYALNVKDEDVWFIKEPDFLRHTLLSDAISDHSTISPALS